MGPLGGQHYSVIEARAHELGQELSRQIHQHRMAEIVAVQAPRARCPSCGRMAALVAVKRSVTSVDGRSSYGNWKAAVRFPGSLFPAAGDVAD